MKTITVGFITACLTISTFLLAEDNAFNITITKPNRSTYSIEADFPTCTNVDTVWEVLTDYNSIHLFVESMESSKIVLHENEFLIVDQKFSSRYLIFKKEFKVRLKIYETRSKEIIFEDISKESFEIYRGSWTLNRHNAGCSVVAYKLVFQSKVGVPEGMQKRQFTKDVKKLLTQLKTEIEQRTPSISRLQH